MFSYVMSTIIEIMYEVTSFISMFFVALYFWKQKDVLFKRANIILAIGMSFRFIEIASECMFGGDVPPASLLLFGAPHILVVIMSLAIIFEKYNEKLWVLSIINTVLWVFGGIYVLEDMIYEIRTWGMVRNWTEEVLYNIPIWERCFLILFIMCIVYKHRKVEDDFDEKGAIG
ncbi:MAG: hypothetical protein Q4D45_02940 [Lachnospiraceae bacterium]|nr:hypothetical protein [Lachnospiraceae bacterium]